MSLEDYRGMKVRDQHDREVVDAIFVRDGYGIEHYARLGHEGLVLDVGAQIGSFACLWHCLAPKNPIVCVETSGEVISTLKANVESFAEVLNATCTYLPWEPPEERLAFTLEEVVGFYEELIRKTEDPTYVVCLKLDVEGMEYNILQNASEDFLGRCMLIVGEYHGNDEQRFRRLCQEKLPDFFYYADTKLCHFSLYNPDWWWRKECGA